jgi:hypothetical protein
MDGTRSSPVRNPSRVQIKSGSLLSQPINLCFSLLNCLPSNLIPETLLTLSISWSLVAGKESASGCPSRISRAKCSSNAATKEDSVLPHRACRPAAALRPPLPPNDKKGGLEARRRAARRVGRGGLRSSRERGRGGLCVSAS